MATVSANLADPKRLELRSRVQSGLIWKIASAGIGQIVSMLATVILARLLSPKQFGVAGMAIVVAAFIIAYSDCGLGQALVQKPEITERDRSTVFWASLAVGTLMTGLCIALAPLIASFYHTPEVEPLLQVLSFSFFLTSLGSTHRSLHYRAMHFRILEIRATTSAVVGEIITIIVAASGGGAWSIVIGGVFAAALSTALLWAMGGWIPRFMFSLESLRGLGGFGFRYLGGTTFTTLNQNADNILVGRVLGGAALGTYTLAYSVILVPLTRLAYPVAQILAPAFARLQGDHEALADSWVRSCRLLAMVFLPFILTVAVTTPDLVHVVFGSKWDAAIPVMRILAIACAMLSIQGVCDSVLQGSGAVRVYLRMSAFSFALNLVAFIVGIQWGLVGMAVAFGISTFTFIVIDIGVVARAIHAPVRLFAKAIVGVLVAALALVVVEVSVFALLTQTDVGPVVRTAVTAIAGLAVFAGLCRWREREAWVELMRFAGETLRGARRGVNDAGVTEAHGPAEAAATPSATTLQSVITGSKYRPFEPGTSKRDVLAGVLAMHAQFSRESSGGPQPRRQLIGRDGGFVEIHSSEAIGTRPANSDSVPIPPS